MSHTKKLRNKRFRQKVKQTPSIKTPITPSLAQKMEDEGLPVIWEKKAGYPDHQSSTHDVPKDAVKVMTYKGFLFWQTSANDFVRVRNNDRIDLFEVHNQEFSDSTYEPVTGLHLLKSFDHAKRWVDKDCPMSAIGRLPDETRVPIFLYWATDANDARDQFIQDKDEYHNQEKSIDVTTQADHNIYRKYQELVDMHGKEGADRIIGQYLNKRITVENDQITSIDDVEPDKELSKLQYDVDSARVLIRELNDIANSFDYSTEHLTPKETTLVMRSLQLQLSRFLPQIISLSIEDKKNHDNILFVMKQLISIMNVGAYDTVLWMPEIWASAISGADSFVGQTYLQSDAPILDTFYCHAMPRVFTQEECPFTPCPKWWSPQWQLHGMVQWPATRKSGVDATGLATFWYKRPNTQQLREMATEPKPIEDMLPRIAFEPGLPYGDKIDGIYAQLTAAHRFLKLPFVTVNKECHLNHNERKPYKRANSKPPEVTTILLRRVHQRESHEETTEQREFSCHFLVGGTTGFWRAGKKWTTGPKAGTIGPPEYVQPYIKGNLDMPFKPATRKQYVAAR